MTTYLEIPHVIVSELKAKGIGSNNVRSLFISFVTSELGLNNTEEAQLERFETFIDANRDELEKRFPELKQEVELESYD